MGDLRLGDRIVRQLARRVSICRIEQIREACVASGFAVTTRGAAAGPIAPTWNSTRRTACPTCSASSSGPASITSASRRHSRPRRQSQWPSRSSYFGIVDLAGFPKDRYYLYKSQWTSEPVVHVLPHWNWAGQEGQTIPIMVYTNAEEVELFVNGKSLGRKKLGVDTVVIPVGRNVSPDAEVHLEVPAGVGRRRMRPGSLRAVG